MCKDSHVYEIDFINILNRVDRCTLCNCLKFVNNTIDFHFVTRKISVYNKKPFIFHTGKKLRYFDDLYTMFLLDYQFV